MTTISGKCLCGDVQFTTPMPAHIDACHCDMCLHWSGGPFIGADFREGGIIFTKDDGLTWYESSDWAKRGFCNTCGSSLFYCLKNNPGFWAIAAGTLDLPKGLTLGKEIFMDDKPDYYAFLGDHPRLNNKDTMAAFMASMSHE
jgi:hypothetical protein